MRIGLFGGSFDPVHFGHIRPVREAKEALGLDRVIFLPTARPPHKPNRQFAPAHARFAMVEMALLEEEGLYASPLELTMQRPAFTIDSLEHFRETWPDAELHLLVGGDCFGQLTTWKRWQAIPRVARLVVLVRPGWSLEEERGELSEELLELAEGDRVQFFSNRPVEVSATQLRRQLAEGSAPPEGAMPRLVLEYIQKYNLYR